MNILTAQEAWDFLLNNDDVVLVDVRNKSEWDDGYPDLSSLKKAPLLLTIGPDSQEFVYKLQNNVQNLSTSLLFLCYSGKRSSIAGLLAEKAGYSNCYNVNGGFAEWSRFKLAFGKTGGKYA